MSAEPTHSDAGAVDPATRRVGTVLDTKWTLDRVLGVGGMAAVYEATHRNGARAAIKLFPFSITTSAESAERILREGYLANKIGHPAVVRVLDDHLDRDREYAYLVMELLEGETARQRIERLGPMTPLEAISTLLALTDCLIAAHAKGVVHRDIKPENLFLTRDDQLKVLDFGVARALDGSSFITRTGAALGTPAYMSPEQARGKSSEISTRSDIYSAGATLLYLVSGEFLHEGETAQEVMVRAAWTPARKIRDRGIGLPDPLIQIIDKACEFEPSDRYQSAQELRTALEGAREALEGSPHGSIAAPRPVRASQIPGAPNQSARASASAADVTIADEPQSSTLRTAVAHRRARMWAGIGLTLAMAVAIYALWPAPRSEPISEPVAPPRAAPAAAAPPPTVTATEASPVPAPSAPVAAPKEAAPPPAKGMTRRAPPRAPGESTPVTAPRQKSPSSLGRDIGY